MVLQLLSQDRNDGDNNKRTIEIFALMSGCISRMFMVPWMFQCCIFYIFLSFIYGIISSQLTIRKYMLWVTNCITEIDLHCNGAFKSLSQNDWPKLKCNTEQNKKCSHLIASVWLSSISLDLFPHFNKNLQHLICFKKHVYAKFSWKIFFSTIAIWKLSNFLK